MSHYHHLTILEREKLAIYLAQGLSLTKIAATLKRNKSTISRERKRNSVKEQYTPCLAQGKYAKRRKACKPHRKLDDKYLSQLVENKFLDHQWSPEQISMRLRRERGVPVISTATIYRAIYAGVFDAATRRRYPGVNKAKRKLRHRGKPRHNKAEVERCGKIIFKIYADETRPLLQGARLTAYELSAAGMDVTLICDNMAATVMKNGWIDAVFVGCDRVAANGDVANKIGTSGVAILAKHYGIPFYVCAPTSTIDMNTPTGADIHIEQRPAAEVTDMWYKERMTADGVKVYNPAFDVTDHELITAIVTEEGVITDFTHDFANMF